MYLYISNYLPFISAVAEKAKKRGRNPDRVGANFDRKTEVNDEW